MEGKMVMRIHPRSGYEIRPVGFRADGRLIWPILGGSEPDGQSATGTPDDGAQSGSSTTGDTGGTSSTDSGQSANTSDDTVTRSDFDRLKNQLSAADRRREEAERRLAEIADKDKSELERATERAKTLETELAETQAQLREALLERAMLTDPEYGADKWHDPEDIVSRLHKAVKDEAITVGEDGKPDPKQVKAFLKETAEKRKYLLKTGAASGATPPSGTPVGNGDRRGSNGTDDAARRETLRKRYRIP